MLSEFRPVLMLLPVLDLLAQYDSSWLKLICIQAHAVTTCIRQVDQRLDELITAQENKENPPEPVDLEQICDLVRLVSRKKYSS